MSHVVAVAFRLKPGTAGDFLPHMRAQARNSLDREPGCLQFDVCLDPGDENRVFLYEIYRTSADFDVHRTMPHYAEFTEAVAPFIADKTVTIWERDAP